MYNNIIHFSHTAHAWKVSQTALLICETLQVSLWNKTNGLNPLFLEYYAVVLYTSGTVHVQTSGDTDTFSRKVTSKNIMLYGY